MNRPVVVAARPAAPLVPARRPLVGFAVTAVLCGWVLLTIPLLGDLPDGPFVLLTLALGLVLPAVVLLRRDPTGSVRAVLRDTVRLPRPGWLLVPALLGVPSATWLAGLAVGGARPLDGGTAVGFATALLSSLLVVNLWEELAWTGFFQRRMVARSGLVPGSLVTAALFVAIHLPLAAVGADGPGDVALGVGAMVLAGVGLRLGVGALDVASRGSLLAVASLHASFNAAAGLLDPDADAVRYVVVAASGILAVALLRHRHGDPARTRPGGRR